jgi:UDP-hydrolysing UDP-N-acetyl-D-glucosamine 2-epimerase
MNITLAHIQGGEITGSIDESVRHAITKLSHIHFTSTKKSKKNVILMGEDKRYVFHVGCPSFDLLTKKINKIKINKDLVGVGANIEIEKKFILVVFHPVTTEYGQSHNQTEKIITAIDELKHQTIWLWPNIDAGSDGISRSIRKNREKGKLKNVLFIKNLQVENYNFLLKKASCLVGNSSSFLREASFFGTPTVLVGNRQDKREMAENVIKCSFNKSEILNKIKYQYNKRYKKSNLYGDGKAAKKISNILYKLNPSIQKKLTY